MPAAESRRSRGRPASISRDDILDAVALRPGGEWTVATVAADLGVSHSAIYYYFPSRAAILAAVVDRFFAELEVPSTRDWRDWLIEFGLSWRSIVFQNPFMVDASQWVVPMRPGYLECAEKGLAVLTTAGFPVADALDVLGAVTGVSQAYATAEVLASQLPLAEVTETPELVGNALVLGDRAGPDALLSALGLVLDGAAVRLAATGTEQAAARRRAARGNKRSAS